MSSLFEPRALSSTMDGASHPADIRLQKVGLPQTMLQSIRRLHLTPPSLPQSERPTDENCAHVMHRIIGSRNAAQHSTVRHVANQELAARRPTSRGHWRCSHHASQRYVACCIGVVCCMLHRGPSQPDLLRERRSLRLVLEQPVAQRSVSADRLHASGRSHIVCVQQLLCCDGCAGSSYLVATSCKRAATCCASGFSVTA